MSKVWKDKDCPCALEVWHWPEFQAFAKKLGVVMDDFLPTTGLIIDMSKLDDSVKITQIYLGSVKKETR